MARPRRLDAFYNGTNVPLSQVQSVVLSVINVGTKAPALHSLVLLLGNGATYPVYAGSATSAGLVCAALNDIAVPSPGQSLANVLVAGVRLMPNQERVPGKTHLIHVRMGNGGKGMHPWHAIQSACEPSRLRTLAPSKMLQGTGNATKRKLSLADSCIPVCMQVDAVGLRLK